MALSRDKNGMLRKNSRGETITVPNGREHTFAVERYRLRRGPVARQMRAQGLANALELDLLKLYAEHQDLIQEGSSLDIELIALAKRQGNGGHSVREPRTATEQLLALDARPGCARRERTRLNKRLAAA